MSEIIQTTLNAPLIGVPLPVRSEVSVRPAVASDLSFIDSLQRMHSDRVGWMQTKALRLFVAEEKKPVEKVKEFKKKVKNDPRLVAAARELRDRWLEQVNAQGGAYLLVGNGKYDVCRAIESEADARKQSASKLIEATPLLAA